VSAGAHQELEWGLSADLEGVWCVVVGWVKCDAFGVVWCGVASCLGGTVLY
jgi:hypothetical protein